MQYLDEPTFNQLRTIEQLGYVVWSRRCQYRGISGAQFVIQSPKESCEYIVNSLNNHLSQMKEKVMNFTDEEFKTQVEAVMVQVAEKDINLKKEHKRFWDELAVWHTYSFDRQEKEVETLKTLTLEEFKAHFNELFFSKSSKRFDMQLTSESHAEKQAEWAAKNRENSAANTHVAPV